MAINTGQNISKAVSYTVLTTVPGVQATKAVSYTVLLFTDIPVWETVAFNVGVVGQPYEAAFLVMGVNGNDADLDAGYSTGKSANCVFTLASGDLPTGLSWRQLSSFVGVISGVPTVGGAYSFTLRATNDYGSADWSFSLTVVDPATISW